MVHVNVFFTDDFRNSTDTRAREKKADQVNTAEMCLKEQEEDAEVRKMWCGLLVHITPTTRSLPTASDVDPSHHTFQIFFVHHCLLSLSRFPCDDDGVVCLLCFVSESEEGKRRMILLKRLLQTVRGWYGLKWWCDDFWATKTTTCQLLTCSCSEWYVHTLRIHPCYMNAAVVWP